MIFPPNIRNAELLQVSGTNELQVIDSGLSPLHGLAIAVAKQESLQYQTIFGPTVQVIEWDGIHISRLTNIANGAAVPPIMEINGHDLILLANDHAPWAPTQLWTMDSNGVPATKLASFDGLDLDGFKEVDGKIYFQAFDRVLGYYQNWRTDGTFAGTIPLSQLSPEIGRNTVYYSGNLVFANSETRDGIVFINDTIDQISFVPNPPNTYSYFVLLGRSESDTILVRNGNQVWRTQGTPESTQLVTYFEGAIASPSTSTLRGSLYFFVTPLNSAQSKSLWKTDGTSDGTTQVAALPEYVDLSGIRGFTEIEGKLFFVLDNMTTRHSEVWTSDSTQSGTIPIATNLIIDDQVKFVGYDGGIGFRAATPEVGYELFRIDTTIPVTAPTALTVTNTAAETQIAWPDVVGAIQYDVWINSLSSPSSAPVKMRVNDPQYLVGSDLANGAYRFWVRSLPVLGNPSAWSVAKDFTVGADPVLFSTPPTTTDTHPTFKWVGPSDAASYEIWLTNRDTKTRVLYSTGLTSTSFRVDPTLTPARYAVWVRGTRTDGTMTNWSTVNEFDVVFPAISVTGGVGIQRSSRPTFTWPIVNGATGYDIQVVLAGTSTVVYQANNLKSLFHVPTMDLAGGNYTVRVQAMKGNRPLSAWGTGQTVRILIPPANLRSTETGFAWEAVPTAVSYSYELRNSLTQAVLYSKTQASTTFTQPAPLRPGQYTLRVYASFVGSASQWTSLSYEIFQPTIVSITSSSAATVDGTPTITWGTITGAANYQIVVTRAGVTAPMYDRVGIVGTSHRVDRILSPGTYQIQVRAIFADGSRSNLSAKQQLVIGPTPVVRFANGVLTWNSINAATHYELWVNYLGTPVKQKIVYQPNTLQTSYTLASTLPKGRYQAWVRAARAESDDLYKGLWSVALNFELLEVS